MWAMGDQPTRAGIEEVMAEALTEVVSWAEDHVFFTRTGAQGARQESVRGVVASTWLHFESRDGDAQLHHHVVVWNRSQTVSDGVWRTLDGKALHPFVVALSERHVGLVEDLMTQRFGVAWRETRAIAGRVAKREVEGVAPNLVAEFSRRTLAIEAVMAEKAAELEAARGRAPTSDELGVIHRAAWRETRLKKLHRSVAEMTAEWCERARPWVGDEPTSWVTSLAGRSDLPALRADDLSDAMLSDVARAALFARSEKSSVFTQANLYADVERQLHGDVAQFVPDELSSVVGMPWGRVLARAVRPRSSSARPRPSTQPGPSLLAGPGPAAGFRNPELLIRSVVSKMSARSLCVLDQAIRPPPWPSYERSSRTGRGRAACSATPTRRRSLPVLFGSWPEPHAWHCSVRWRPGCSMSSAARGRARLPSLVLA
jgi:conjugative relaxase-like TrwC/TraI family protein